VAIGIDARNGMVATRGWLETSTLAATDLAQQVEAAGATAIIYTDIHRDGTLQGPNKPALQDMAAAVSIPVIASGGIGSVTDLLGLLSLEPAGVTGVIVGRALYTGDVELREALQAIGPGRIQDIPPDLGQSSLA
jgi:phosphoribosylformimino-5-aminoimidazole carboxamide ribotide isomerase